MSEHHRALASKYGVDLATVEGTGADGRLQLADVLGAVKAKRTADRDAEIEAARAAEQEMEQLRAALQPARNRGPAWARNPLVDQVRAQARASGKAAPSGPEPTLFASGDLPAFTASAIPPSALLDLPRSARHPAAAAATTQDAYAIALECTGADAEQTAAMLYGDHPGNEDYAYRVQQWQVASMSDSELLNSNGMVPGANEELARREAALPLHLSAEDEADLAAEMMKWLP